ncbi:MAG: metallophosphoesterase family protein [Streptosporangiales bacterium]
MDLVRTVSHQARHLFGRRVRHRLAVTVVALAGAWFGLLLGGSITAPIGPVDAHLSLRPSLTGNTFIDVAPLGSLELDTTDSPLALNASVEQIRVEAARQFIDDPDMIYTIQDVVASDLEDAIIRLAAQAFACSVLSSMIFVTVVFRRWTTLWKAGVLICGLMLISFAAAAATWNPRAMEQPRYTGLLTTAPTLVGNAQNIKKNFGKYRTELARVVTGVSRLYETTLKLPTYEPDPNTIRVLHVSDIHNNPAAWNIIKSTEKQFQVDFIVDTGDLTDLGTKPEQRFANNIESLDVPYVFVKGNHDSKAVARAVARQDNATVLDGQSTKVDGVRIWGIGDPRYVPDKLTQKGEQVPLTTYGQRLRRRIEDAGTVDMVMTHDPAIARQWDGLAPLILAGHIHQRKTELLPGGSRLMVEGSTGGAGVRALDYGKPTPITMDLLYLDKQTHRLQAWDSITLGGVGLTSAQIERHVEEKPNRPLDQLAGESPKPSVSPTPSGGRTPFTLPPSTPASTPAATGGATSPGERRAGSPLRSPSP